MGSLGAMAMIGGQEAANAAKATNIADNLEKISVAMMAFYGDNVESIDRCGTTTDLLTKATQAYLKKGMIATNSAANTASATEGAYSVFVTADGDGKPNATNAKAKWYTAYTLLHGSTEPGDGQLSQILASKADRLQLKASAAANATAYVAGETVTTVYMLVR